MRYFVYNVLLLSFFAPFKYLVETHSCFSMEISTKQFLPRNDNVSIFATLKGQLWVTLSDKLTNPNLQACNR